MISGLGRWKSEAMGRLGLRNLEILVLFLEDLVLRFLVCMNLRLWKALTVGPLVDLGLLGPSLALCYPNSFHNILLLRPGKIGRNQ